MGDVIPFMLRQMLAKESPFNRVTAYPTPVEYGTIPMPRDPWNELPSDCNVKETEHE